MLANELYVFAYVVKTNSISKAAKQLGLTPAAVSKIMTRLENEYAVKLLIRKTRSITVTNAGITLYQKCRPLTECVQWAGDFLANTNNALVDELTLGAPVFFLQVILAQCLPTFQQKHPDIRFTLASKIRKAYPEPHEYSAFIKAGYCPPSPDFTVLPLVTWDYVVCAAPSYLSQHPAIKTPHDLLQHNCLDFNYRTTGRLWEFYPRGVKATERNKMQIGVKSSIDTASSNFVIACAVNAGGIINVPIFTVKELIQQGLLEPVLLDYAQTPIPVSLIHSYSHDRLPMSLNTFIDYLLTFLKAHDYNTLP